MYFKNNYLQSTVSVLGKFGGSIHIWTCIFYEILIIFLYTFS